MKVIQNCSLEMLSNVATLFFFLLFHFFPDSSGEKITSQLHTRFFMLVKIIFDFICPKLREMFISLWDKQRRKYGPWSKVEGTAKLSEAIGHSKKLKSLPHETRKRIATGKLDNFDPTCLFNVILYLRLFQLDQMERGSVEKLKTIRDDVLHEKSTNMSEDAFKKFIDEIYNAFRGLKWETDDVQQLIEAQQCVSVQEYQRLKQIYEHEKQQLLDESRHMHKRVSHMENTMEGIELEVNQLKYKFEDKESGEATKRKQEVDMTERLDKKISSLESSVCKLQEAVMLLKPKDREAKEINEIGIFIERQNDANIKQVEVIQQMHQEQKAFLGEIVKDIKLQQREPKVFITEDLKDILSQHTEAIKEMQLQHEEQRVSVTEAIKEIKSHSKEMQANSVRRLKIGYEKLDNDKMTKNTQTEMQSEYKRPNKFLHKVPTKPQIEHNPIGFSWGMALENDIESSVLRPGLLRNNNRRNKMTRCISSQF